MYDHLDERNIPVSTGIPPVIYISAIVGIIAIFGVLTLVFSNSRANHAWPSSDSLTIPLSAKK
ncbi:MAG: hypothetical protein NVS2B3_12170 [Vulcanimicrobiaceae bacterium]